MNIEYILMQVIVGILLILAGWLMASIKLTFNNQTELYLKSETGKLVVRAIMADVCAARHKQDQETVEDRFETLKNDLTQEIRDLRKSIEGIARDLLSVVRKD